MQGKSKEALAYLETLLETLLDEKIRNGSVYSKGSCFLAPTRRQHSFSGNRQDQAVRGMKQEARQQCDVVTGGVEGLGEKS